MKTIITIINLAIGLQLIAVGFNPILLPILGIFFIVNAIAFWRDKRWAIITLPALPLGLSLLVFYMVSSLTSDVGMTSGPMAMTALILLVLSVIEISYLTLRKPKQFS